jgi:hypothetical protein
VNTTALIIVAAVIVIAIIAVAAWIGLRRRRLQSQFGSEYQRVAEERGSKWRADSELVGRRRRRQKLEIRPLEPQARDRYARDWQQLQGRFVDQPYEAVAGADRLVMTVMGERGYPTENFDQHAADLSVDYPNLVENYRGAHAVATRQKSANTEELRTAMLHYRALFDELLGVTRDGQEQPSRPVQQVREPEGSEPQRDGEPVRRQQQEEAPALRGKQR